MSVGTKRTEAACALPDVSETNDSAVSARESPGQQTAAKWTDSPSTDVCATSNSEAAPGGRSGRQVLAHSGVQSYGLDSTPAERAQTRIGRVIRDKWRLDRLLGVGGQAAVYEATHRNGKRAAIKVLHAPLSLDPQIRSRFLREGMVANRIDHPGAISVLDDDITEEGEYFLVMEFLEGQTLAAAAKRAGPGLPVKEVLDYFEQVLDVLIAAHDKGILHRDIKPENIFITSKGAVKVLDFGIARLREIFEGGMGATQIGLAMGTPGYMPPEQARGRWDEVDARSDLWAVGATLFSVLVGRTAHEAQTISELSLAAMTQPVPPFSTVVSNAPQSLCTLMDGALAFKKEDRFPDARAMRAALVEAKATAPLSALRQAVLQFAATELSPSSPRVGKIQTPVSVPVAHGTSAARPAQTRVPADAGPSTARYTPSRTQPRAAPAKKESKTYVEWEDRFCVGVQQIDSDHKKLVELINDLHSAMIDRRGREALNDIVARMMEYAVSHFATEERLMMRFAFAGYASHKAEHDGFMQKVIDLQARLSDRSLILSLEVITFLRDWLTNHIIRSDKAFGVFLQSKGVS